MLDGKATDALEASSLGFQLQYVDIFSNCWGPKDDGKTFGKPGPLAAKALKRGAETVNTGNYLMLERFKVKPVSARSRLQELAVSLSHVLSSSLHESGQNIVRTDESAKSCL